MCWFFQDWRGRLVLPIIASYNSLVSFFFFPSQYIIHSFIKLSSQHCTILASTKAIKAPNTFSYSTSSFICLLLIATENMCSEICCTSHGILPSHTWNGVSLAFIAKWGSPHLQLLKIPTKFSPTAFCYFRNRNTTTAESSLVREYMLLLVDIGYSQPWVPCNGFRGILL